MRSLRSAFVGAMILATGCLSTIGYAQTDHAKKLDEFLNQGKLADAEKHFATAVSSNSADPQARVALGLTQFLQAVEGLGQANYRFGLMNQHTHNLPLARMPVPMNKEPEQVSYDQLREMVSTFASKLATAEASLAEVKTASVQLPFYIGRARLDLDGDGKPSDEETLWRIFAAINDGVQQQQGEDFFIGIDGADVHWLRGYCHFLMAVCDVILAYDQKELFERCGQLIFPNVDSPYLVAKERRGDPDDFGTPMILDSIAAIHLVNFKLKDKARMISAHQHLLTMIEQSRKCWERAENEMDDDHEWIPNDRQTGVMEIRVSRDVITGWHKVLDELEDILQGERLLPYWRKYVVSIFGDPKIPAEGTGVNLKKLFLEPRDFDLVLTIQGTNVEPFLDEGKLSTPEAWTELTQVFRGQFFGFAIWFN